MARLRLLFALFLVAVGTTFGAFAISGYFEPHMRHGQSMTVSSGAPQPAEKPQLALWLPNPGFGAGEERPAGKAPAKPKVAAKTVPTKPKPATSALPAVRDKRPQPKAAEWPWNLLGL